MSNLHAILTEQGKLPEYPDDSDWDAPGPTGTGLLARWDTFAVANGDRYVSLGRADDKGQPLLVGSGCPREQWDEFAVPADGIELRHGPLSKVCDLCGLPMPGEVLGNHSMCEFIESHDPF
jgi:hypothetical protein